MTAVTPEAIAVDAPISTADLFLVVYTPVSYTHLTLPTNREV